MLKKDIHMQVTYNLPQVIKEDLEEFKNKIEQFKKGKISPTEFRTFRVPQGIYEQREEGTYMLRVRIPAGCVLPYQMRTLANVSKKYGNGVLHITTRQDIQIHRVLLDDLYSTLLELFESNLSTKGGGGNTVRNITACYDSGVCPDEIFDVTQYAIALTEYMLSDERSFLLPRKFKIAFSGCPKDCATATVNDIGFIAKKQNKQLGFSVFVGGGMGAYSCVGNLLDEFVPAEEIHLTAEAVKRVFDKYGNRKNKHKARLRFLIQQIGFSNFKELYKTALLKLRTYNQPLVMHDKLTAHNPKIPKQNDTFIESEGFINWKNKNAISQKQNDYFLVHIPLLLGDMTQDKFSNLAETVEAYGEGMIRTTPTQNLVIRWIHKNELSELYKKLISLNLDVITHPIFRNMITCAGASTCKLGICLSRGLALAIMSELEQSKLDLDKFNNLNINISGCPNSCGKHPIGQIGLYGTARRFDGRLVPHYVVQLGGKVGEGVTKLAEGKEAIPAHNVPSFILDFLYAFQESIHYPNYYKFLEIENNKTIEQLIYKYKNVPNFNEDKNYYFDWGAETPFSLAGRGPGECGAGILDLIEVDLASAKDSLKEGKLLSAIANSARALLIIKGEEAKNTIEALKLFENLFINTGVVNESFRILIEEGLNSLSDSNPENSFQPDINKVSLFVEMIQKLYYNLDQNLSFPTEINTHIQNQESIESTEIKSNRESDLSGVVCPLNYVKTKLLLEQMNTGEVLSIYLDREGARNVPQSAEKDGHKILSIKEKNGKWQILIKKG